MSITAVQGGNVVAEQPTKSVRMSAELVDLLSKDGWYFGEPGPDGFYSPSVRITQRHVAALTAERRATVERIEHRLHEEAQQLRDGKYYYDHRRTNTILDEEAAR